MKEILIEVPLDGEVKITTIGFVGNACKDATASLERALGGEIVSDTPTEEAFQSQKQQIKASF